MFEDNFVHGLRRLPTTNCRVVWPKKSPWHSPFNVHYISLFPQAQQCSLSDLASITTGHVINLISNDVQRFDQAIRALPSIILAPFAFLAGNAVLFYFVGAPTLLGTGYLITILFYQGYGSTIATNLRRKAVVLADKRVKIMNEIIRGIRTIKICSWEEHFGNLVSRLRGLVDRGLFYSTDWLEYSLTAAFSVTCTAVIFWHPSFDILNWNGWKSTNHSPLAWPLELVTYFHKSGMKQTPVCILFGWFISNSTSKDDSSTMRWFRPKNCQKLP